jgi:hypothetical protein
MYENGPHDYDEQMLIANGLQLGKQAPQIDSTLFTHYLNLALQKQQQQKGPSTLAIDLLNEHLKMNSSSSSSNKPLVVNQLINGTMNGTNGSGISSPQANINQATSSDFCDICQKQFCNKYYLKKHKQDVHGVWSTTPTSIAAPTQQPASTTSSTTASSSLSSITQAALGDMNKKKSNDSITAQSILNSLAVLGQNNASNNPPYSNIMKMPNNKPSSTNTSSVSSASSLASVYSDKSSNLKRVDKQMYAKSDSMGNFAELQEKIANELKLPMGTLAKSATSARRSGGVPVGGTSMARTPLAGCTNSRSAGKALSIWTPSFTKRPISWCRPWRRRNWPLLHKRNP